MHFFYFPFFSSRACSGRRVRTAVESSTLSPSHFRAREARDSSFHINDSISYVLSVYVWGVCFHPLPISLDKRDSRIFSPEATNAGITRKRSKGNKERDGEIDILFPRIKRRDDRMLLLQVMDPRKHDKKFRRTKHGMGDPRRQVRSDMHGIAR